MLDLSLIFGADGIFSLTWNELVISFNNVNALGAGQSVADEQPIGLHTWLDKMNFWRGLMGRYAQACKLRYVDGVPEVEIIYEIIGTEPVAAEGEGGDGVL
jgi:hypothetical protein